MSSLLRSSLIVSFFTLCSRLLGFVRDIFIALYLGTSAAAEAFFVAFRLPNMFRAIFAEGAFNVVFVPLLNKHLSQDGQREAELFSGRTFIVLMAFLLIITAVAEIFMPTLIGILAPGFDPAQKELTIAMARVTFPYLIFIAFVSFCGGILNSLKFFAAAAAAPTLLNITFIISLLGSHFIDVPTEWLITYAVPMAGFLQALLMFFALKKSGFKLRLNHQLTHPSLTLLIKRMAPALVGVGAQQINLLINTLLASTLATGAISYLYYADRLNQLPIALIGIAIGTALLPQLSRNLSENNHQASTSAFIGAFKGALALGLSAAFGLFILAEPLMQILFVRGAFTLESAQFCAEALKMYALGLPAFILIKLSTTVYYSAGDTKTPVKTALLSVATNISLSLLLITPMAHMGLALASSCAVWISFLAQLILILRKNYLQNLTFKHLLKSAINPIFAALPVGFITIAALKFMPDQKMTQFIWLIITVGFSGIFFLFMLEKLKILSIKRLIKRR